MGSYSDVVDISSEEEDANNSINNSFMKNHLNGSGDALEWFDDLIIMDELSTPPVVGPKKTVFPTRLSDSDDDQIHDKSGGGDEDDDCQVLDSDPDKSAVAVSGDKVDDSDEIEIVGSKGEVACRDFPHPRHLCANFPFNTTSHDKYCKMCHCYVCDSPAPCTYWGNSIDFDSHCHATDKIPMWKKLRDSNKAPSLQKNTLQNVTSRAMPPWCPVPQKSYEPNINQVSRPISIQIPSQRSTNIGPITTGSMHGHRSGPYLPFRSHQLTRSNSMHVDSRDVFKRTGQPCHRVLNMHQTQPGPVLNQSHSTSNESLLRSLNAVQNNALQRTQSQSSASMQIPTSMNVPVLPQTQMVLTDVTSKSWQDILASVASELGVPDYSVNSSVVQQPINTSIPAQSGTIGGTQTGNMPARTQLIDSTMEQNTSNLIANGISGNLHANVQDAYDAVVSSPLFGFDENWIDMQEFSQ
ncbi:hypothetical protein FCM35_KLT06727 [Carex littledalei]|uniref:RPM1 interacting protein 13 n=1 Tax=Carex littledalei TaxID=544730 RepID=A0A833V825_9POAL|nr:hypothetical protein FCM35_KLT06727 [Carex littledalei]